MYRITFLNQGNVVELYARQVSQGGMWGFVEIEEIVFGERTKLVVDPGEDRLRNEFGGVKRAYIPLHSVVRIDEVDRQGVNRITGRVRGEASVMPFPTPVFDKPSGSSES
jgi:hypothetical protein